MAIHFDNTADVSIQDIPPLNVTQETIVCLKTDQKVAIYLDGEFYSTLKRGCLTLRSAGEYTFEISSDCCLKTATKLIVSESVGPAAPPVAFDSQAPAQIIAGQDENGNLLFAQVDPETGEFVFYSDLSPLTPATPSSFTPVDETDYEHIPAGTVCGHLIGDENNVIEITKVRVFLDGAYVNTVHFDSSDNLVDIANYAIVGCPEAPEPEILDYESIPVSQICAAKKAQEPETRTEQAWTIWPFGFFPKKSSTIELDPVELTSGATYVISAVTLDGEPEVYLAEPIPYIEIGDGFTSSEYDFTRYYNALSSALLEVAGYELPDYSKISVEQNIDDATDEFVIKYIIPVSELSFDPNSIISIRFDLNRLSGASGTGGTNKTVESTTFTTNGAEAGEQTKLNIVVNKVDGEIVNKEYYNLEGDLVDISEYEIEECSSEEPDTDYEVTRENVCITPLYSEPELVTRDVLLLEPVALDANLGTSFVRSDFLHPDNIGTEDERLSASRLDIVIGTNIIELKPLGVFPDNALLDDTDHLLSVLNQVKDSLEAQSGSVLADVDQWGVEYEFGGLLEDPEVFKIYIPYDTFVPGVSVDSRFTYVPSPDFDDQTRSFLGNGELLTDFEYTTIGSGSSVSLDPIKAIREVIYADGVAQSEKYLFQDGTIGTADEYSVVDCPVKTTETIPVLLGKPYQEQIEAYAFTSDELNLGTDAELLSGDVIWRIKETTTTVGVIATDVVIFDGTEDIFNNIVDFADVAEYYRQFEFNSGQSLGAYPVGGNVVIDNSLPDTISLQVIIAGDQPVIDTIQSLTFEKLDSAGNILLTQTVAVTAGVTTFTSAEVKYTDVRKGYKKVCFSDCSEESSETYLIGGSLAEGYEVIETELPNIDTETEEVIGVLLSDGTFANATRVMKFASDGEYIGKYYLVDGVETDITSEVAQKPIQTEQVTVKLTDGSHVQATKVMIFTPDAQLDDLYYLVDGVVVSVLSEFNPTERSELIVLSQGDPILGDPGNTSKSYPAGTLLSISAIPTIGAQVQVTLDGVSTTLEPDRKFEETFTVTNGSDILIGLVTTSSSGKIEILARLV